MDDAKKKAQEETSGSLKKEGILYLAFGVATTVINYMILVAWTRIFGTGMEAVQVGNVVAFVFAVIFAFVTNKLYVFGNKDWSWKSLKKEIPTFLSARLLSLAMEQFGLFLGGMYHVESHVFFGINGVLYLKGFLNVLVVVFNYFASKFVVFRKRKS